MSVRSIAAHKACLGGYLTRTPRPTFLSSCHADKATSELLPGEDLAANMQICDLIRSKQVQYGPPQLPTMQSVPLPNPAVPVGLSMPLGLSQGVGGCESY